VPVPLLDQLVQLRQRLDLRHWHDVVAAEVADLALNATLLVGALDAGPAVEALDPEPPRVREF
jgi:hypothetical protein